jgi:selenide,water dikinase
MLANLGLGDGQNLGTVEGQIALDCSVRKTRQGHFVISTTDFFFPLVDSPYLQGRIGAANVLSDLYAEGVGDCDFVLMLLAVCRDMPEVERGICTTEMVKGFRDACSEAGAPVTGGQTVMNPWPIIGGVATAIVAQGEFVPSDGAQVGDVLVLTKPLGTQVAVNVHEWKRKDNKWWKECQKLITSEEAEDMMHAAVCSMARLNRNGGRLMIGADAHAATDVTGFGIVGHAQNLVSNQAGEDLGMEIHTLPCIAGTAAVNNQVLDFGLLKGMSAETSGGLLICIPADKAEEYCKKLEELDGCPSWVIGKVVHDTERKAKLVEGFQVLEV